MTTYYTIVYGGTENSLAGWGVRADVTWRFANKERDALVLNTVEAFDPAAPQFAWGAAITLYAGRTYAGGVYSGGTIVFQGLVGLVRTAATGGKQGVGYEVYGPWWLLQRLQFKQTRNVFAGWVDGPGTPASGPVLTPVVLAETFLGEDPGEVMWTGAQALAEILNWANECWNPTKRGAASGRDNARDILQLGAIDCGQVFPKTRANTVSCAEAMIQILRYFPATVCWFDYTTTPPTLNLRDAANLAAVSETISANQEKEIALAPEYERQLAGVMITYKQVTVTDGVPWPSLYVDRFPATITDYTPNVLSHVIDIPGWKVNTMKGTVSVAALAAAFASAAAARAGFWINLDRALQDPLVNPATVTAGVPVSVTDNCGNPIDTANYPNILLPGSQVASWMVGVHWIEATIQVQVGFSQYRDSAFTVLEDQVVNRLVNYQVILTNAASTTYSGAQLADTGEAVPPCYPAAGSLAQAAYTSASTLSYQGRVVFLDAVLRSGLGVGKVLTLVGPNHTYPNLLVQAVECRPHYGELRVEFGPSARIDAGALVELWRASRWRTTYHLPSGRSSGLGSITASFDTSGTGHKENTSHGVGSFSVRSTTYDQGTAGSTPNGVTVIQQHAPNEAITIGRVNGSTGAAVTTDGSGNAVGSISLVLANTGGKAVALRAMPDGSRVLASPDFAPAALRCYCWQGFASPNAWPNGDPPQVLMQAVPWTEGWTVSAHPPSGIAAVYVAMADAMKTSVVSRSIPDLLGSGTPGTVTYGSFNFASYTSGGNTYWHQSRLATAPSGCGLPNETHYLTESWCVNDVFWCDVVATGLNVQMAAGDPVTAATVVNGGTGYQVGDPLTVAGGTGPAAALTVAAVSSGVITAVTVAAGGSYTLPPANPVSVTGGHGTGATFTLLYTVITLQDANKAGRGWAYA